MIAKEIKGSITKTYLKKIRLHCGFMNGNTLGVSQGMMDPLYFTS